MQINTYIKRLDRQTNKWSAPILISTQKELEYHRELQQHGIEYVTLHLPAQREECESCSA